MLKLFPIDIGISYVGICDDYLPLVLLQIMFYHDLCFFVNVHLITIDANGEPKNHSINGNGTAVKNH